MLVSLALAFLPLGHALRASWQYRFSHYRFGDYGFSARFSAARIWTAIFATLGAAFGGLLLCVLAGAVVAFALGGPFALISYAQGPLAGEYMLAHGVALAGLLPVGAFVLGYWRARVQQLVAHAVRLEAGLGFSSELSGMRLGSAYLVNGLAIVATAGLATPWAVVRTARMRWSALTLLAYTDVEQLVDECETGVINLQFSRREDEEMPAEAIAEAA